jgi:hypothetical protein
MGGLIKGVENRLQFIKGKCLLLFLFLLFTSDLLLNVGEGIEPLGRIVRRIPPSIAPVGRTSVRLIVSSLLLGPRCASSIW